MKLKQSLWVGDQISPTLAITFLMQDVELLVLAIRSHTAPGCVMAHSPYFSHKETSLMVTLI
jgi:hypothetical protein